jgi:hypothetical protein
VIRATLVLLALALPAQQPQPYRDPPFACEIIDYGTEPPTVPAPADDPLCVRYDKTNITVSTLGVVDFLAAEPGRVAIVAGKCSYWQQDHWIVRAAPDATPIVEWEGSYWYDGRTGAAAGIVRGMRVGGQPADGEAFAAAMAPLIGDDAAADLASYAAEGGGGGASFALPEGFGAGVCPAAQQPSTTTTTTATTAAPPSSTATTSPASRSGGELARTGRADLAALAAASSALAMLLRRLARA